VSFYKLAGDQMMGFALVGQLVQKALAQGQQVLCLMPDSESVKALDSHLWEFQSSSFLPHGRGTDNAPIAVSCDPDPGDHHQILINLQPDIPTWFSRFDRVIEIIYQNEKYEQSKRDNFLFYKQRGYALSYHDLSEKFKG
jgi:DNA polymerase-3 subunit chi